MAWHVHSSPIHRYVYCAYPEEMARLKRCNVTYFCVQMSSSDRVLLTAFREIGQMADRLNLPRMIAVSSSAAWHPDFIYFSSFRLFHSTMSATVLRFWSVRQPIVHSFVHWSGQILLPRYLMNGLSSLDETTGNIHQPLLMTWSDSVGTGHSRLSRWWWYPCWRWGIEVYLVYSYPRRLYSRRRG